MLKDLNSYITTTATKVSHIRSNAIEAIVNCWEQCAAHSHVGIKAEWDNVVL